MKSYGFEMLGPFEAEVLSTLPVWVPEDEAREIYVADEQKRYFGDGTTWVLYSNIASGTVMVFGNNLAPVGWVRKSDWQDTSMFCYKATGNITSGGSIDPKSTHTHTGPSHTHTMQNHTHSMQGHTHSTSNHTHSMQSHTHTGPSHTHTISHNHSHDHSIFSISGTILGNPTNAYDTNTDTDATGSSAANTGSGGTGNTGAASVASTSSSGAGTTGAPSTSSTDVPSNNTTVADGTGATGSNTAPYFQELIAAIKE